MCTAKQRLAMLVMENRPSAGADSTLCRCFSQVVQLFDSWAHHLSPAQFREFSLPYANRIMEAIHATHPDTPLIFHANGGMFAGHLCRSALLILNSSISCSSCVL